MSRRVSRARGPEVAGSTLFVLRVLTNIILNKLQTVQCSIEHETHMPLAKSSPLSRGDHRQQTPWLFPALFYALRDIYKHLDTRFGVLLFLNRNVSHIYIRMYMLLVYGLLFSLNISYEGFYISP